MLVEHGLFGVHDKVAEAIANIIKFRPADDEPYYVAFSGGKDSMVALDLVQASGVPYDAHYNMAMEPPEAVRFIKDKYPKVVIERPPKTMWQLIVKKRMPPTRKVRYCCEKLKERGGKGRFVITGVRKAESVKRSKRQLFEECRQGQARKFLHPIIDWSDSDVWQYIRERGLPYCKLYDRGHKRIGCVMCPMVGKHGMLRDAAYWPQFYKAYLRAFQRMVDKRIADGLPIKWRTGQEVMDWWINNPQKPDGEQDFKFD